MTTTATRLWIALAIFLHFAIFAESSTKREASAFRLVPQGLEELAVPVQPNEWVDRELELPSPDFVRIYECDNSKGRGRRSLKNLGKEARSILDDELPSHGAVLFRNLPCQTAREFGVFWNACDYNTAKYFPFYGKRKQVLGIDLATNIPSNMTLACHNEMCYNPRPCSRIAFYCLKPAVKGGETLVARNRDITRALGSGTIKLIKKKGGIVYVRRYVDRNVKKENQTFAFPLPSWQDFCGCKDRSKAIQFFEDQGFDDISFDEEGGLIVRFEHSGLLKEDGHDVWFNIVDAAFPAAFIHLGDGTAFTKREATDLKRKQFLACSAFKLQRGDWLVLDNLKVQHGRLPYVDDPDPQKKRTLLTVYTE
jgi:hypothetical protein